jgi:hypothetical protein
VKTQSIRSLPFLFREKLWAPAPICASLELSLTWGKRSHFSSYFRVTIVLLFPHPESYNILTGSFSSHKGIFFCLSLLNWGFCGIRRSGTSYRFDDTTLFLFWVNQAWAW